MSDLLVFSSIGTERERISYEAHVLSLLVCPSIDLFRPW
jgi:hypothetical protein